MENKMTAREIADKVRSLPASDIFDEVEKILHAREIDTIDHEEHRWYVEATKVYKVGDEYLGVNGPVRLKSESMMWSDLDDVECDAFEMEAVPSITYKKKR